MLLPAASAVSSRSEAWDVDELAFLPPLPIPPEWRLVHELRRARQLLSETLLPGREQLDACIIRRGLEHEASRQRELHDNSRSKPMEALWWAVSTRRCTGRSAARRAIRRGIVGVAAADGVHCPHTCGRAKDEVAFGPARARDACWL